MKSKYKKIKLPIFAILFLLFGAFVISCSEDDESISNPEIEYIRVTNPESSDSLIVAAGQGSLIAIIGKNLGGVEQIWFNDLPAVVTPTYVTNTTILVNVPSNVPGDITNRLRLVFKNGKTLEHNFVVAINEPAIYSMKSEFVNTGDIATIRGNYFYEPLTVKFEGGVEAEITSVTDELLEVRVPEGAKSGQITITSNFGETKSDFFFRDNRNIFISSDPFIGWWGSSYVVSEPEEEDPPMINGNYIRVNKVIGAWTWTEIAGADATGMGELSKNIPDDAILSPAAYNLKFEVNTKKPYNSNIVRFSFGLSDFTTDQYFWNPPYDTQGAWQTVVIPFDEVAKSYTDAGLEMKVNPNGYSTRILIFGAGELDSDISFDNFRIVPKTLED